MSLSSTLLRARRKFHSDGGRELLSEIATTAVESDPARSFARKYMLSQASILEQSQLKDRSIRHWDDTVADSMNPFESEIPIPPKRRLPNSQSFDGLQTSLPTSPFVAELENVTVLSPSGIGITPDSELIKDTVASADSSTSRIEKILARSIITNGYRKTTSVLRSPTDYADRQISLATTLVPVWQNYYHWTLECLPKLLGVETYYEQTGESPTILLPPDVSSWMRESLELVGGDWLDTAVLQPGTTHADRFVIPSYPTPSRAECFWLRDRAHKSIGLTKQRDEYPSRIYVTRRNANIRRVKNESEVLEVLSEFNVQPYALETLTVAEQIQLFANADFVISPHGAGLANLVYATSPTVLELFGYKEKTTFYRLSKQMRYEYHAMFCTTHQKDLCIDTGRLNTTINDVIEGNKEPIFEEDSE